MYLIRAECGMQIQCYSGRDTCTIIDRAGMPRYSGRYADCVAWLAARNIRTLS